jgi:hypothetical protein
MSISAVVTFRVRDGGLGEQLENLKAVKQLVERGGAASEFTSSCLGDSPALWSR